MSGADANDYPGYIGGTAIDDLIARRFMDRMRDVFPQTPGPGPGGYPQPTPTPTPTPTPSPNLQGLMQQSADPWGTYGQMGVNEPYLSNINNRFGWSSQGLAYPTQLQATPTWYNPPIVYPKVVQPPLNPVITPTTGK